MKFFSCVLLLGVLTMFGGRPVSSNLDVDNRFKLKKLFKKVKIISPLDAVKNIAKKAKDHSDNIKEGFAKMAENIDDFSEGIKNGIAGKIAGINDDIKNVLGDAFGSFKDASKKVKAGMALLKGGVQNSVENVVNNWKVLIEAGKSVRTAVGDFASKYAEKMTDAATEALKKGSFNVVENFQDAVETCLKTLKNLAKAIKELLKKIGEAASNAKAAVGKAIEETAMAIMKAIAKVTEPFRKVAKLMKQWLSDEENMKKVLTLIEPQLTELVEKVIGKLEEKGVTDYFPELADLIEEQASIDNLAAKMSSQLDDATADIQSQEE